MPWLLSRLPSYGAAYILLYLLLTRQVGYVQIGGYCVALLGFCVLKDGISTVSSVFRTRKTLIFLAIAASLLCSTFVHDTVRVSNLPPLSRFLYRSGLRNDKTVFVTMATKDYLDSIINFRTALDKFGLRQNYLILCLDTECLEGARSNDIIAYGGYLMSGEESDGDFHMPVARAKVRVPNPIVSDCSWRPILTSSTAATTLSCSMQMFF